MTNTVEPPLPKQIQATIGSEAWWATHLLALIAAFVAVASLLHPSWVPLASPARAWVTLVALALAVLCVVGYLVFALLHHKISIGTLGTAVAGEITQLESIASPGLLDTLRSVPVLQTAIDAVAKDIAEVRTTLGNQPDIGGIVKDELAKLGWHAPGQPAAATAETPSPSSSTASA